MSSRLAPWLVAIALPWASYAAQVIRVVSLGDGTLIRAVAPGMAVEIQVFSDESEGAGSLPLVGAHVDFGGQSAPLLDVTAAAATVQVPALVPGNQMRVAVRGGGIDANATIEVRANIPTVIMTRDKSTGAIYPLVKDCGIESSTEPPTLRPGEFAHAGSDGFLCIVLSGTGIATDMIGVHLATPRVIATSRRSQLVVDGLRVPVILKVLDHGWGSEEFAILIPAFFGQQRVMLSPGRFDFVFDGTSMNLLR